MKNATIISQNKLERKDFRWNFAMGLIYGTLFTI